MSIIVQALTSNDDREIVQCLRWLRDTTAGTQFIHEAFLKDNPEKFTRPWFAWANTLFGELILTLAEKEARNLARNFVRNGAARPSDKKTMETLVLESPKTLFVSRIPIVGILRKRCPLLTRMDESARSSSAKPMILAMRPPAS